MALTQSNMLELGTKAPYFELPDTISGKQIRLNEVKVKKALIIMFICNHCPYVIHVREELVCLSLDYQDKGVGFVAISSNDIENYPDDNPEKMKEIAKELNFPFPY